ncbi:sensor histidine kinase [Spirosoma fluviale]|uniref:histidine kinase n=1 Tax=Spirosoma fluviale TaxID=1597977 RepID=A0A286FEV5_9BACT|nr:HAMP domain-containing sensor histidine kinase [Spirosoma fluviale]SOD81742.1 Signal transduction histidine kinase [Spirosoma fluviale]
MTIRNRISLQFSLIVASILLLFSVVVYATSAHYRQEEFYERLKRKARTTVKFLVEVKEIDQNLLKIIDRNSLSALIDEKILVFNARNKLVYASIDDKVIHYRPLLLNRVREEGQVELTDGENEVIGLLYRENGQSLVVLASAFDQFGKAKLSNLRHTLIWSFLGGIGLTLAFGFFFAGQSLQPISKINQQVQTITANNLQQRLNEGKRQDEIDQLAINFNHVLVRLEQAFDQQRSFVSHASHELRTPLTALKSEIQLGLLQRLSPEGYELILQNLLTDTDQLIALSNSLLSLARTMENLQRVQLTTVRLDEIIFSAQDELLTTQPAYRIQVDYDTMPDTELLVRGNEDLLRHVVMNLLDNACKYSAHHEANVFIGADSSSCWFKVQDAGIGMTGAEMSRIFEPFFRASNALNYEGFGVGLSICQRIVALHQGSITVVSELGCGSTFTVKFPHIYTHAA